MIVAKNKRPVALATVVALILSSVGVPGGSSRADDTDIFTQSFPPNLMVILDRSGSMHWRPDGTGTGATGNVNVDCMDTSGNATNDGTNGCAPFAERRIYIAVDAMKKLLDRNGDGLVTSADTTAGTVNFRFGYMRYYDPNFTGANDLTTYFGAGQLARIGNYQAGSVRVAGSTHANHSDVGTDYEQLWNGWPGAVSCTKNDNWNGCVDGMGSLQARGGTPMAASLEEARRYFSGYTLFSPEKGPTAPSDGGPMGPDPAISGDTGRSCRLQYAILITDGADTYACGGSGSESQSDQYRRRRASATAARDLARAGVKLFVIGFGALPTAAKNTLNWMAWYGGSDNPDVANSPADPSTVRIPDGQLNAPCNASSAASNDPGSINISGYAFFAENATQLTDAINKAVTIVTQEVATFTAPTVATVRTTDSNKVYLASFKPQATDSFWPGNLTGFALDSSGAPIGSSIWGTGAGEILQARTAPTRTMYTINGSGTRISFDTTNNAVLKPLLGYASDLTTTNTDKLINYIRGAINRDGTTPASERWKLGDIFHSNPKVVGPPSLNYFEPYDTNNSFGAFRNQTNIKTRKKVIYTGANEGTLHAFDAGTFVSGAYDNGTGAELWAFIPPFNGPISASDPFLSHLQAALTASHAFFVDGSPRTADVWWGGSAADNFAGNNTAKSVAEWRTVLIAGQRKGGHYYTALNVTDPAAASYPAYLWSLTDSKLGETWAEPIIGKVKIKNIDVGGTALDRWVAIVGGGYDAAKDPAFAKSNPLAPSPAYVAPTDAAPGVSNAILIIDIATGKKIWEFTYLSTDSQRKFLKYSFPSSPAAVDISGDGYLDRVYIGDLGGQMWRIDISAVGETSTATSILSTASIGTVANWTGARLFSNSATINDPPSDPAHPIYYPPSVAFNSKGELFVYFGTGDRENNIKSISPAVTTNDRFYSVKDSYAGSPVNVTLASELQNIPADFTGTSADIFNPTANSKGWFIPLHDNEKAISGSTIFAGLLFFPTFLPAVSSTDPCLSSGSSRLFAVNFETAQGQYAADGTILPASKTTGQGKWQSLGEGTGIASSPVISIGDLTTGEDCKSQLLMTTTAGGGGFATSGGAAGVISTCTPTPKSMIHIRSWRQL